MEDVKRTMLRTVTGLRCLQYFCQGLIRYSLGLAALLSSLYFSPARAQSLAGGRAADGSAADRRVADGTAHLPGRRDGLSGPGNNLVGNAGFEDGTTPWILDNWMKNEVVMERDSRNPHSGTWSMRVELAKVLNSPIVMFVYPHLIVRPGSSVRVKFWARGVSNGANLTIMIRHEVDPRPTYLRSEMNLTDEWQQYIYTVQLPATTNPNATSLRFVLNQPGVFWIDDISVEEMPPADNGPAPHVNPVRNASFEAGADGWTALFRKREFGTLFQESGAGAPAPDDARLDVVGGEAGKQTASGEGTAPQGQHFLRVNIDRDCKSTLTSAFFPARYGQRAHLSFYLRSDSTRVFDAGIGAGVNSSSTLQLQKAKAATGWQQFTLPFTLKPSQDGVYYVCFRFNEPGLYELDAVSYVEDEQSDVQLYTPATAIQPVPNGPVANLFAPNDTAFFKLVTAGERPGYTNPCQITIVDYLERKIAGYTVPVSCNANGYSETLFKVPTRSFGAFRIEARPAGSDSLLAEQIYSVLPPLPPPGDRPDSYFGGHFDLTPYSLEIARKAGFRWLRTWPPLLTTWIAAEPQPGIWHFPLEDIQKAVRQGFQISGILGTAPDFRADINPNSDIKNRWSKAYPPLKIGDWKEYVSRCITAYYPYIKTWELWNEPDGGFMQVRPPLNKADVYMELLKATREVVDSLGKPLTLMAPAVAAINASLGWELLKKGAGTYLDAYSFHFYSLAAGGSNPDDGFVLPLLEKFRTYKNRAGISMPLWHSEGGMYLQGSRSWLATYRIPPSSPAKKQQAAASMVRAALLFKAMGVQHYFDFELSANAAGRTVNGDATTGFIEVTGIPGPAIAAHAAMVAITEDAAPAGFEDVRYHAAHIKTAHFKKDKDAIDVYWSDLDMPLKKVAKLQPSDKVLDMMGNPIPPESAQTSEFPLYVIRASGK